MKADKKAARAARRRARKQIKVEHTPEFLACYRKSYGAWAGNSAGRKPDHSSCCEEVGDRGFFFHQCSKPNGHGPHGAYCAAHDPKKVEARRLESQRRYEEARDRQANAWKHGAQTEQLIEALERIAAGHNDPRTLAAEVLSSVGVKADE